MTPPLHCPACRSALTARGDGAHTCTCGRTYPEVAGVPDLRLRGDRYLTLDEDRRKAERLAREELSFAETLALYWSLTPQVPPDLAAKYTRTALDGVRRARTWLDGMTLPEPGAPVVDVGCGTGALGVALAERGLHVTGVDLALRWLVAARRQAAEAGVDLRLVAGDGRALPLPERSVRLLLSVEALEHTDGQAELVDECVRVVAEGGRLRLVTANRFSLAVEPNVGLWGVGLLPRRLAPAYVRRRRGTRYQFFRAVSPVELARYGRRHGLAVHAGPLPTPPLHARGLRQAAQSAYDALRRSRGTGLPLAAVAPFLELTGAPVH